MDLFYDISGYFTLFFIIITMIIAFTWKDRKGKVLICMFFLLKLIASLQYRVINLLIEKDLIEWSPTLGQFLNISGIVIYQVSNILLLCFVIVARKPSLSVAPGELSFSETDLNSSPEVDPRLVGIGGWLILPAIGLVLGGIMSVAGFAISLGMFSEIADAGYGEYFALSIFLQIGLFILLIVAAVRFFGKKKSAPTTMIVLMLANVASSFILMLVAFSTEAEQFAAVEIKDLISGIIGSAIWIPYFRTSKRVKATFVKGPRIVAQGSISRVQPSINGDDNVGYDSLRRTEPLDKINKQEQNFDQVKSLNLKDCPHCNARGVLPMTGDKCPNCKNPFGIS